MHIQTHTSSRTHPHAHILTHTSSRTHPHAHILTHTSSRTHPHAHILTVHMALVGYFIVFSFVTKPGQTLEFLLWGTIVPLNFLVGYYCSIVASTPQPMAYASILTHTSSRTHPHAHYTTSRTHPHAHILTHTSSRTHPHAHILMHTSSRTHPHAHILTYMHGDCGVPHCPFYGPFSKEFPCGVHWSIVARTPQPIINTSTHTLVSLFFPAIGDFRYPISLSWQTGTRVGFEPATSRLMCRRSTN